MATTTNFGWETPDDTDYVTAGAAAMRELGQDIDTSLVDLKGGTTGQLLSKNSNTDLDYVWVNPSTGDITGVTAGTGISGGGTSGDVTITNSMATAITTAGDLIYGTGAGTFTRRGIGTTGQVLRVNGGTPTWETLPSSAPASTTAYVSNAQTTTSSTFTDLATAGPAVTITTGTKALVIINCNGQGDANSARGGEMGFQITGASSLSAQTKYAWKLYNNVSNVWMASSQAFLITGLTAGSNTFTAKYRSLNAPNTFEFADRHITVVDMGS